MSGEMIHFAQATRTLIELRALDEKKLIEYEAKIKFHRKALFLPQWVIKDFFDGNFSTKKRPGMSVHEMMNTMEEDAVTILDDFCDFVHRVNFGRKRPRAV